MPSPRTILLSLFAVALCAAAGCCGSRQQWCAPPLPAGPGHSRFLPALSDAICGFRTGSATYNVGGPFALSHDPTAALASAEAIQAQAVEAELACAVSAPGLYYQAATFAWQALRQGYNDPAICARGAAVYHLCVARLLSTAQQFGQFAPGRGLFVLVEGRRVYIPLVLHSSIWRPDDLQEIFPVGCYQTDVLSRQHRRAGWGVPVVVRRRTPTQPYLEETFLNDETVFASTILFRPGPGDPSGSTVRSAPSGGVPLCDASEAVLEVYDPLTTSTFLSDGKEWPLAADVTAPLAFAAIHGNASQNALESFINPNEIVDEGLFLIEPYQPGKIPVIFVHGLLSSPATWVDLANDLRAIPGFHERFQIWGFRYSTGRPFLRAAARLRRDLYEIVERIDPKHRDAALRQMVVVGHSMGGLVSKLQVVASRDCLWRSVARVPFDRLVADHATRVELSELFFFEPQPYVRCVVFLATPHKGSPWARRPVGRLAAALARPDPQDEIQYQQVLAANPGVFTPEVQERIPSSIDMLEPSSCLLQAIYDLKIPTYVSVYSVIGTGEPMLCVGAADGIVPVESALYPGSIDQLFVPATHTWVHRVPPTVAEVSRVLGQQLLRAESFDAPGGYEVLGGKTPDWSRRLIVGRLAEER